MDRELKEMLDTFDKDPLKFIEHKLVKRVYDYEVFGLGNGIEELMMLFEVQKFKGNLNDYSEEEKDLLEQIRNTKLIKVNY